MPDRTGKTAVVAQVAGSIGHIDRQFGRSALAVHTVIRPVRIWHH